jgi:cell division protein FtsW
MKSFLTKLLRLRPLQNEPKRPKVLGPADPWMTATLIGLVAFGVVMVYSASAVFAAQRYDDSLHFLVRQSFFAVAGIGAMFAIARIDYHRYKILTYPGLGLAIVMLVFVAIGFGRSAGGAARWIAIGPFNIQPAEPTKVMLILWLAYSLSKKREHMASFSIGFLPHVLMAGLLMLLCLKQPDFGSAVMIGALTFVMLFTAGARVKDLLGGVLIAAPAAAALILLSPYRMRRIQAFMSPLEHRQDVGYHITQSFMSFGAGGVTGVGIGDSRQKLLFLPEAHTDFISAIIGEELGYVGILLLIGAFVFIVVRGLRAATRAADDYGSYLAVGITVFIGLQALTNLSVAMGLVPTKGLVLPFISYGGSSLLVNCAAAGILLNVSRPRQPVERAVEDESDVESDEKQPVPQGRRSRRNRKPGEASIKVREGRAR